MVVVVEAGGFQLRRLLARQHAERGAGLETQRLDALDHGADGGKIAILGLAPGRAHAEARGAVDLGRARFGEHGLDRHQLLGLDAGIVLRRLRAIGAVLRAAAGLDRQQGRNLHLGRIEILPVCLRRLEHQFRKGQIEQRAYLLPGPIVAGRDQAGMRRCGVNKRHQ